MDNNNDLMEYIGKNIIKEIKLEIPGAFFYHTEKKCEKCEKYFKYDNHDSMEKMLRILYSDKSGNLDMCLDCDEKLGIFFDFYKEDKEDKEEKEEKEDKEEKKDEHKE
jgi:hypothetical protein